MDRKLEKSGNVPLDRQIGGLLPQRPYLVSGGPGAGKSVSCLEFLDIALEHGERSVLLTHDDPADVIATAAFLGIDLERALRDERLILLRYQLDFVRRFGRAASTDDVFAELGRLIGTERPTRVAIDSMVPFLEGGGTASAAIFALTAFLQTLGATSLLTYPGDLGGLYDRRLEPLMQRAGGFFHLVNLPQGRRRGQVEIRKLRYEAPSVAPVRFRIEPGAGFVQDGAPNEPEERLLDELRRHLLIVNVGASFPPEALRAVEWQFRVTVRAGVAAAFSDLLRTGVGAVLLNVQRDTLRDGLQLVRELRRSDVRTPIVVVTPYLLRSNDRTRALRAGADDFVSLRIPEVELVERLAAVAQRGRSALATQNDPQAILAQPRRADGTPEVLTQSGFVALATAYLASARAPFFSLIQLTPPNGDLAAVGDLALRTCRIDEGDLVGIHSGGIAVLADGARPKDLEGLAGRLREAWASLGKGELGLEIIGFPAQEERVLRLFGANAA
jgi:KaiC/GvpD/RAD55 family RecA-like ATPase/DNA-binding NarL/FixJ family response regulator